MEGKGERAEAIYPGTLQSVGIKALASIGWLQALVHQMGSYSLPVGEASGDDNSLEFKGPFHFGAKGRREGSYQLSM